MNFSTREFVISFFRFVHRGDAQQITGIHSSKMHSQQAPAHLQRNVMSILRYWIRDQYRPEKELLIAPENNLAAVEWEWDAYL